MDRSDAILVASIICMGLCWQTVATIRRCVIMSPENPREPREPSHWRLVTGLRDIAAPTSGGNKEKKATSRQSN